MLIAASSNKSGRYRVFLMIMAVVVTAPF